MQKNKRNEATNGKPFALTVGHFTGDRKYLCLKEA